MPLRVWVLGFGVGGRWLSNAGDLTGRLQSRISRHFLQCKNSFNSHFPSLHATLTPPSETETTGRTSML